MVSKGVGGEKGMSSLRVLRQQRSHVLFVLSNATPGSEQKFLHWYRDAYSRTLTDQQGVLDVRNYEQHEIDITQGRHPRLPYRFLTLCSLSLDGAQEAENLLERIATLHREQPAAQAPATWLYYPLSDKVGRSPDDDASMITLAFANGLPGREGEFREWYATRHIRHALNIPALVSGRCFERTQFQRCGSMEAQFAMIALYEQTGTPQDILDSFATIELSKFDFPALDLSRFAEWVYRPV